MGLRQYLSNSIMHVLPPTRYFYLKTRLLTWSGFNVHLTARIVSSVQIWGQMPLYIGKETFIGHDVMIIGSDAKIHIGNYVDIAPRVCLVSGSHYIDVEGQRIAGQGYSLPIFIEDGVWIGAGSTIIGGVTIGQKSIIGAGSVVIKDIPPFTIAIGNPCHPIKHWDNLKQVWVSLSSK